MKPELDGAANGSESRTKDLLDNGKPTIEGWYWFNTGFQFDEWEVVLVTKLAGEAWFHRFCSPVGRKVKADVEDFPNCKWGLRITEPVI